MRVTEQREVGLVIQTVILSKDRFPTKEEAEEWIRANGFLTDFEGNEVDETANSWRYRQAAPGAFVTGSFRTFELTNGVQAVGGKLK